jgi:hypothetical protein
MNNWRASSDEMDCGLPASVLVNGPDEVAGQRIVDASLMGEMPDVVAVIPIETVLGGDPQESPGILQRRHHRVLRQPLIDGQVPEHHGRQNVGKRRPGRERKAQQQSPQP